MHSRLSTLRRIRAQFVAMDFTSIDRPDLAWDSLKQSRIELRILATESFDGECRRILTSASNESPQWPTVSIFLGPTPREDERKKEAIQHLRASQEAAADCMSSILSMIDAVQSMQKPDEIQRECTLFLLAKHAVGIEYVADTAIASEFGLRRELVQGHLDILEKKGQITLIKDLDGYAAGFSPAQLVAASEIEATMSLSTELPTNIPVHSKKVFIGHGRSREWYALRDFVEKTLELPCVEFNNESTAGISTTDRLVTMLDESWFALLVHTGEDQHADSTSHARENVIHETGLFQGRLGFRRAIVLLEEDCQQFSNIHGLTHIRFAKGRIENAFEEVRRVLERERRDLVNPTAPQNAAKSTGKAGAREFLFQSAAEANYLMSMSRPRNQQGVLSQLFDQFPDRKKEEYRGYLEHLESLGLARRNGTTTVLTHDGYRVADGLWEVFILQELERCQSHRHEYIDSEQIAAAVELTDGTAETRELERLLGALAAKKYVEAVTADQGIVAVRITPTGAAFLRPYKAMPLGPVS